MKHINITFILTIIMSMVWKDSVAHDFEAKNSDGVTIYYNYRYGATDSLVYVTYRGKHSYSYSNEYSGNVVIPETVTYNGKTYSVTAISQYAFYGCTGLTSIIIPESVTKIGEEAFVNCSALTSVIIPENVSSMGKKVFYGCSGITEIVWNPKYCSGFSTISPFDGIGSKVTKFNIGNNVTMIPAYLCKGMGMTSISIPNSVKTIGAYAFEGCQNLTSVSIPSSVSSIGYGAFCKCSGLTSVTIPNGVTSIGDYMFEGCQNLSSVTIPGSVTSIAGWAFSNCENLASVSILDGVTRIEEHAFAYCPCLKYIAIPSSVTYIGEFAFYDGPALIIKDLSAWCKMSFERTSFKFSATLYSDDSTRIDDLVIPDDVDTIKNDAFSYCTFNSITIHKNVSRIEPYAFEKTKVNSIIWNAVNCSADNPFGGSAAEEVVLGNEVQYIPSGLCSGIKKPLSIPESVRHIGESAFAGCTWLTELSFPHAVYVDGRAFQNCINLTKVSFYDEGFWTGAYIGTSAFKGCKKLASLELGNVAVIGEEAFVDCPLLTSVEIPAGANFSNAFKLTTSTSNNIVDLQTITTNCSSGREFFDMIEGCCRTTSKGWESRITLYVPYGAKKDYEDHLRYIFTFYNRDLERGTGNSYGNRVNPCVYHRWNIIELEPDAIENVTITNNKESMPVSNYDFFGRQLPSIQRGLNIQKMSDGTTKKIRVK